MGDLLASMRLIFLCFMFLAVGCAPTHERVVRQLVHDNGANESFTFGWYHDVKALDEFEGEARKCADQRSGHPGLKRATLTASITECLIENGWRLDGFWEIVVL